MGKDGKETDDVDVESPSDFATLIDDVATQNDSGPPERVTACHMTVSVMCRRGGMWRNRRDSPRDEVCVLTPWASTASRA